MPLSKRNEGNRAEAILEYNSKGVAAGQGLVKMRGEGGPCKNENDEEAVRRMGSHVPLEKRESTIPQGVPVG